jgi:hypothetical protein
MIDVIIATIVTNKCLFQELTLEPQLDFSDLKLQASPRSLKSQNSSFKLAFFSKSQPSQLEIFKQGKPWT